MQKECPKSTPVEIHIFECITSMVLEPEMVVPAHVQPDPFFTLQLVMGSRQFCFACPLTSVCHPLTSTSSYSLVRMPAPVW